MWGNNNHNMTGMVIKNVTRASIETRQWCVVDVIFFWINLEKFYPNHQSLASFFGL